MAAMIGQKRMGCRYCRSAMRRSSECDARCSSEIAGNGELSIAARDFRIAWRRTRPPRAPHRCTRPRGRVRLADLLSVFVRTYGSSALAPMTHRATGTIY
jgi:hypothetical protein